MEKLEAAPKKQFFKDCALTKRKWEGNPGGRNNRNKNIRGGETKMPMVGWGWGGWKSTNACRVPSSVVYTGEKRAVETGMITTTMSSYCVPRERLNIL